MGGGEDTQRGRHGRPVLRRALLLVTLGTLAGTLFLCARAGEATRPGQSPARVVSVVQTVAAPAAAPPRAAAAAPDGQGTRAVRVSPYGPPGCSPLAHVTPGVLPVPPPATAVVVTGPPVLAHSADPGPGRPAGAPVRAPDLHALQVLRT
ncbi:hypothetical protein [Streptomyces sp. NPDC051567]|uniref:hypothetical protein n=1 Tax=Streptomyces sp. NPDC051567 TaxID=3365660 RepID=UPI0037945E64